MTPIQEKITEIEKECSEFGHPLNISLWELKIMIREYSDRRGFGTMEIKNA